MQSQGKPCYYWQVLDTGFWPPARRAYPPAWKPCGLEAASERYWMFFDATVEDIQVIQHRESSIQHRSFNGNLCKMNFFACLIGFMQR